MAKDNSAMSYVVNKLVQEVMMQESTSFTEDEKEIPENSVINTVLLKLLNEPNGAAQNSSSAYPDMTEKVRNMKRKCAMVGCKYRNCKMFHFPNILKRKGDSFCINPSTLLRVYLWLKATGDVWLLQFSPLTLSKNASVCEMHFKKEHFKNSVSKKLLQSALPTSTTCEPIDDDLIDLYEGHFNYTPGFSKAELEKKWKNTEKFLQFDSEMEQWTLFTCSKCKEKQVTAKKAYHASSHHQNCSNFSHLNNMDPGTVPSELSDLTFIEEHLIARVHPLVSIFKLKPGQQYCNIKSFPQDVEPMVTKLPHKIKDLKSVINIKCANTAASVNLFRVRRRKVYAALVWLTKNNKFYKDVKISAENLAALDEDENVGDQVSIVVPKLESQDETMVQSAMIGDGNNPVNESGTSGDTASMERIPINEFTAPGLIACAFPCLFPTGEADLRDSRTHAVTPSEYFKHLMLYYDDRFNHHPTFRFLAKNYEVNIFVQNHPEFEKMTGSVLKNVILKNPGILKKLMYS